MDKEIRQSKKKTYATAVTQLTVIFMTTPTKNYKKIARNIIIIAAASTATIVALGLAAQVFVDYKLGEIAESFNTRNLPALRKERDQLNSAIAQKTKNPNWQDADPSNDSEEVTLMKGHYAVLDTAILHRELAES